MLPNDFDGLPPHWRRRLSLKNCGCGVAAIAAVASIVVATPIVVGGEARSSSRRPGYWTEGVLPTINLKNQTQLVSISDTRG